MRSSEGNRGPKQGRLTPTKCSNYTLRAIFQTVNTGIDGMTAPAPHDKHAKGFVCVIPRPNSQSCAVFYAKIARRSNLSNTLKCCLSISTKEYMWARTWLAWRKTMCKAFFYVVAFNLSWSVKPKGDPDCADDARVRGALALSMQSCFADLRSSRSK